MSNPYRTPASARVCYCHTQKYLCTEWWQSDNPGFRFRGQGQDWHDGRPVDVLRYGHDDGRTEALHFDVGYLVGRGGGHNARRANDVPLSTAQHTLGDVLLPADIRWLRATLDTGRRDALDSLLARPLAIDARASRDRGPVVRVLPSGGGLPRYVLAPVFEVPDPNQAVQLHGYDRWSLHALRLVLEELAGFARPRAASVARARPCADGPPAAHFINEYLVPEPEGTRLSLQDVGTFSLLLPFAQDTGRFGLDEVACELENASLYDDEREHLLSIVDVVKAADDRFELIA